MVTILANVNALSASRQLGVSKIGLNQAITRLTTGRRINSAADDSGALVKGNAAMAASRKAGAQVYAANAAYFAALNADGANAQKTADAYRMAEMEGAGTTSDAEYTALQTSSGGTTSTAALSSIAANQVTNAAAMSSALTSANLSGIESETQLGIADAWLGADIGAEMAQLTKYQIMMQAGTSALNNANQSAQTVLGLFR
ncbi:MAG: flagellin [Holophaga sp.]|nr:flagellin [Holophaga sp.]